MKHYIDRLRGYRVTRLELMLRREKADADMAQRNIKTIEGVLAEKRQDSPQLPTSQGEREST